MRMETFEKLQFSAVTAPASTHVLLNTKCKHKSQTREMGLIRGEAFTKHS